MSVQALTLVGLGFILLAGAIPGLTTPQHCAPPPLSIDCGSPRGWLGIAMFAGAVLIAIGFGLGVLTWTAARSVAARAMAQTVEIAAGIVAAYWWFQRAGVIPFVLAAVPSIVAALALGLSGVRQPQTEPSRGVKPIR